MFNDVDNNTVPSESGDPMDNTDTDMVTAPGESGDKDSSGSSEGAKDAD